MKKRKKWLPKDWADRVKAGSYNTMAKNNSSLKIILHDEGNAPGIGSATGVMRYVINNGGEYHFTWDTKRGKWCQSTPMDKASKACLNAGFDGGIGCNRSGTVAIQICVIGFNGRDGKKFTDGPMKGAWVLAEIADSWGIPLEKALGDFKHPTRSASKWRGKGVSGHLMAPGNDHGDPGRIDFKKLVKEARRQQRARDARRRRKARASR